MVMIDSRILATLKSRNENPAYSVLITGYDTQEDCSQEKLIIHLHQINKSLSQIESLSGANILSKDLIIQSDMDYDEINNAFKNVLIGYTNYNGGLQPTPSSPNNIMSNYIEMVDIELQNPIEIDFNRAYNNLPAIIPTIDKKYKSYYKSYDLEFKMENNKYTGVIITFNKFKRKGSYPMINFTIIGDVRSD